MRATRAVIGSFGAGISLAIASSVALLVVSSVVAFRGWPGAPSGPRVGDVARLTDSGTVRHGQAGGPASLRLPAARASVPATGRARHGRPTAVRRTSGSTAANAAPAGSTPVSTATSAPAGSPAQTSSGGGNVVSRTGKQAADAVRQTTQAAGQALAPVAAPVGRTLEQVGAAGGDAVQQVTDTAGKLVP